MILTTQCLLIMFGNALISNTTYGQRSLYDYWVCTVVLPHTITAQHEPAFVLDPVTDDRGQKLRSVLNTNKQRNRK